MTKSIIYLLLAIFLISCSGIASDEEIEEEFNQALAQSTNAQVLSSLIALDQKYTHPRIKLNIGTLYLTEGQYQEAKAYFDAGISLNPDSDLKYIFQTNYGELYYRQGEYEQAIESIDSALELNVDDPIGGNLTAAKSLIELGQHDQAVDRFDSIWDMRSEDFNSEDIQYYIQGLSAEGKYSQLLSVITFYKQNYGFTSGMGLIESIALEEMGDFDDALVAIVQELDLQRFTLAGQERVISEQFAELLNTLKEQYPSQSNSLEEIGSLLMAYLDEEYNTVLENLDNWQYSIGHDYFTLIKTAAHFMAGQLTMDQIGEFASKEQIFSSYPAYYYFFWNGLKRGPGDYSFQSSSDVLVLAIENLGQSKFGKESRVELAKLLDIEDGGENLLIPSEIQSLILHIIQQADRNAVDLLLDFLELPESVYTNQARILIAQSLSNGLFNDSVIEYMISEAAARNTRVQEVIKGLGIGI